jgi:hypothetical protein
MWYTKLRSENLKGRDHFEDLGVDGSIILKLILKTAVQLVKKNPFPPFYGTRKFIIVFAEACHMFVFCAT